MTGVPPDCPLTQRQYQCLRLRARGRSYKQIAIEFGVGASTVRQHLHDACGRLGLLDQGTLAAVAVMYQNGWLDPSDATPSASDAVIDQTVRRVLTELEHRPEPKLAVSPAQYLYLRAFERHLKEQTQESRDQMSHAFVSMCHERDIPDRRGQSQQGPPRDPFRRLLRDLLGEPELNERRVA